jgi:hypothetical protein
VESKKTLPEFVERKKPTCQHSTGYRVDNDGYLLNEDFGNSINSTLEFTIFESSEQLMEGNFEDAIHVIGQN